MAKRKKNNVLRHVLSPLLIYCYDDSDIAVLLALMDNMALVQIILIYIMLTHVAPIRIPLLQIALIDIKLVHLKLVHIALG